MDPTNPLELTNDREMGGELLLGLERRVCVCQSTEIEGLIVWVSRVHLSERWGEGEKKRRQQDSNLRPQRGTDNRLVKQFESVAVTTWL